MQNNINSAIIFAAGLGLRMRPLTETTPKPLIELNGKKLIDYSVAMLDDAEIDNKIINSFYLAEQIENHFLDRPDIKITKEDERLETGGGIKNALPLFKSKNIISVNSDVIIKYKNNPVKRLIENWNEGESDILMLLINKDKILGYSGGGDFSIDESGFLHKGEKKDFVFTGLQIINTSILEKFDKKIFSLSEVFNECLSKGRLKGIIHDDVAFHVGDISALREAEKLIK